MKTSQTEQLIDFVKQNSCLYDHRVTDFKNVKVKEALWQDLAYDLNLNVKQVKSKWRNLRDSFCKHMRSQTSIHSEASGRYKRWHWSKHMEFLAPHLILEKRDAKKEGPSFEDETYANDDDNDDSAEECRMSPPSHIEIISIITDHGDSCDEVEEAPSPPDIKPDLNKFAGNGPSSAVEKKTNNNVMKNTKSSGGAFKNTRKLVVNHMKEKKMSEFDATELIFLGYAKILKSFSVKRQLETKMKISQIMLEQEMAQLHDNEPS